MQYQATLTYNERLVTQAVRSYWRHSITLRLLAAVAVVFGILVWRLTEGDRSWLVGFLAAVVVLGFAMPILVYVVHYKNSMAKLRDMKNPVATFVANENSLTLATDHATSTLKWDAIREVWRFEAFWLLLFSKAHFVTIPLEGVSEEMRAYVLERVESAGGKVSRCS